MDRWLGGIMGIEGLPIPYRAPNASPFIERFMRTLREEALDHFIFLSVDHVLRVVSEYVRYYNGAFPSQAIQWTAGQKRGAGTSMNQPLPTPSLARA
jgi:hypothetical protein